MKSFYNPPGYNPKLVPLECVSYATYGNTQPSTISIPVPKPKPASAAQQMIHCQNHPAPYHSTGAYPIQQVVAPLITRVAHSDHPQTRRSCKGRLPEISMVELQPVKKRQAVHNWQPTGHIVIGPEELFCKVWFQKNTGGGKIRRDAKEKIGKMPSMGISKKVGATWGKQIQEGSDIGIPDHTCERRNCSDEAFPEVATNKAPQSTIFCRREYQNSDQIEVECGKAFHLTGVDADTARTLETAAPQCVLYFNMIRDEATRNGYWNRIKNGKYTQQIWSASGNRFELSPHGSWWWLAQNIGMCQDVVMINRSIIYVGPHTESIQQWHTDLRETGDIVVLVALTHHNGVGGTGFLTDARSCKEVVKAEQAGTPCVDFEDSNIYTATYQNIGDTAVFSWETFHRGMGNNHESEPRLLLALNYGMQMADGTFHKSLGERDCSLNKTALDMGDCKAALISIYSTNAKYLEGQENQNSNIHGTIPCGRGKGLSGVNDGVSFVVLPYKFLVDHMVQVGEWMGIETVAVQCSDVAKGATPSPLVENIPAIVFLTVDSFAKMKSDNEGKLEQ
ncbi:unnamed protein product [Cylindrotheca closterium]|uniref:Uncharacterized protein n=1 Tax=Cylindrotheca closterium TaxID=2856 RepID=A0AAD2FH68_9STRA|nr:unnamed protein product [Cylindrotheca closterium]